MGFELGGPTNRFNRAQPAAPKPLALAACNRALNADARQRAAIKAMSGGPRTLASAKQACRRRHRVRDHWALNLFELL
jgi:hypothetical protein